MLKKHICLTDIFTNLGVASAQKYKYIQSVEIIT